LLLVGDQSHMDALAKQNEALPLSFSRVELRPLPGQEAGALLTAAFEAAGLGHDEVSLQWLVMLSGGVPALLTELGEAAYQKDKDGQVGLDDVLAGIADATGNIASRYLDREVYEVLRSEADRTVLGKLAAQSLSGPVCPRKIMHEMTEEERRAVRLLILRLREFGVLRGGEKEGEYYFPNALEAFYIMLCEAQQVRVRTD